MESIMNRDALSGLGLRARLLAGALGLLAADCGGNTLPLQGKGDKAGGSGSAGDTSGENTAGANAAGANPAGDGRAGGNGAGANAGGRDGGVQGGSAGAPSAGTGGDLTSPTRGVNLFGAPIYTRVQRLTSAQWERAVTDILRLEVPAKLPTGFDSLAGGGDFTNNEKLLVVDPRAALASETGAEAAAAMATGSDEALSRLHPDVDPEQFVRTLGRRAFRRPLTAEEETRYQAVFTLGETLYGDGFAHGAALVIRAMLESPHFLYRSELGPGGEPLSGYEVASKLSFWLLGTTPSDDLLDAAAAGELDSVEGVESFAHAMLETPAALAVMRDFHTQLYGIASYASVDKLGVPEFSVALRPELEQASLAFFDDVFARGAGLREILTSTRAFVGPLLAPLYGMAPAPAQLEARDLGSSRVGYFMQVPFLLLQGRDRTPNTVGRGLTLAVDVLCRGLPPPAAGMTPEPPPLDAAQTNRQRFESLTGTCGGACHAAFEPLGFACENFDGMGEEREADNGLPVDTSGSYLFAEGVREFSNAKDLMRIMADGKDAHLCYAKKLSSYALQRDIVEADRPFLDQLAMVSRDDESLKAMAIALVRDPAFRVRHGATP
jgi:hypothetical protein